MDWTVPCYLAWQESSHRLIPALAAPLVSGGFSNLDQNISEPTPQIALGETQVQPSTILYGLKSDRPAQNSDDTTSYVTTSEPLAPAN